jgi:hypothetical protein
VQISEHDRHLLVDALDMHLQGMSEAETQMIEDRATLSDFKTFDDTMQLHASNTQALRNIRNAIDAGSPLTYEEPDREAS